MTSQPLFSSHLLASSSFVPVAMYTSLRYLPLVFSAAALAATVHMVQIITSVKTMDKSLMGIFRFISISPFLFNMSLRGSKGAVAIPQTGNKRWITTLWDSHVVTLQSLLGMTRYTNWHSALLSLPASGSRMCFRRHSSRTQGALRFHVPYISFLPCCPPCQRTYRRGCLFRPSHCCSSRV